MTTKAQSKVSNRRRGGRKVQEMQIFHLDWNCNSTGALTVTAGNLGIPSNRAAKVTKVIIEGVSDGTPVIRGFQLFNNAGVAATTCAPVIMNSQKPFRCVLIMPQSEDMGTIPASFAVVRPTPAVGGFRAIVHCHVKFAPQTVYPSLA